MKSPLHRMAFVALTLAMSFTISFASCETGYISIKDIRETLPERWTGDYIIKNGAPKQLKKGDTVSIDAAIVIPEVDAVPVVRITWEPLMGELDESLEIGRNELQAKLIGRNFPKEELVFPATECPVTFDPALPWEEASDIAISEFHKWLPFMRDKELTLYFQRSRGDSAGNGFQSLFYYTAYHGIPYIISDGLHRHILKSEYGEEKNVPAVPLSMVDMRIKRPGQFSTNIFAAKEVGVDIEDIPLLPFHEIMKKMEQWVTDGYAYSLNEVRFGYMCFIDPDKKGEEFVLLPVWAAKGRTRTDLKLPFDLKTEQAVKEQIGYWRNAGIVVNAQTGQVYDFENDKRPDRRYIPHIITWDEVQ